MDEELINSKTLRQLLGDCSDMHIWRMCNDAKYRDLRFPQAIKIGARKFWRRGEVRDWIASRPAAARRESVISSRVGEATA